MGLWEPALRQVLETSHTALEREGVQWALVGSVATALQGCHVTPRDVDLGFAEPAAVHRFGQLMAPFLVAACEYPPGHERWLSSTALPVAFAAPDPTREVWTFGRWLVDGVKVEAAHIARPASHPSNAPDAGIWETGQQVWPYVRRVTFGRYRVPVVPLEIQLETNLRRGLTERIEGTLTIFREHGYDRPLLERSLPSKYRSLLDALARSAPHGPSG